MNKSMTTHFESWRKDESKTKNDGIENNQHGNGLQDASLPLVAGTPHQVQIIYPLSG
jgi:hypothetical protein